MAPYESGDTPAEGPQWPGAGEGTDAARPRAARRAARYVVPFAVVGVAAATIGLVPALADSGDPDLPRISAEQLLAKIAKSDTRHLSGTVKINTDLGLPDLGAAAGFAPPGEHTGGGSGASADPRSKLMELASGSHTLRVAADGPTRQKLSVLEDASEYSIIRDGDQLWAYDSASDQAYHAEADGADRIPGRAHTGKLPESAPATPDELARQALKAVDGTTSVTVDGTERVAGRDAYKLVVKPRTGASSSTIGAISIAVDAKEAVPLKFTLTPAAGGSAVVDAGYTKVDFSRPAASTFRFTPPKGTKVTEADQHGKPRSDAPGRGAVKGGLSELKGLDVIGKGWGSIAEFTLPGGHGMPSASSGDVNPDAQRFLNSLGGTAHGKFGSGTVFSTRLVNALITQDGKIYAGAVTKDALVKAANAAH
ncbi:hypothetical protein GCM10018793_28450 [Streptomyces sulfonofaciens]|uniref:Outer membrane lipoprotein carrier protein LolA n=1 Tax=Streptomyces sulfonofaciens TaxID=68272 RepID=A0A919KZZ2_9ACTN|nr:DUF2092 domain-containing protein [Streptomyces sulfonofaciens]GHH78309.1 hypothetical protein GCM10018793_28450 [Streptomyces sulfonofaciens]